MDAVVGNPPYVRQEGLGDDKAAFQATYKVFNSIADLYTYFIERGHKMLRLGGRFGMITANKFMRANYGALCLRIWEMGWQEKDTMWYQEEKSTIETTEVSNASPYYMSG